MPGTGYTGRFAPSPTGELHIGSLACALASWLDARAAGGRWLVRIEDLDPPREKPGAADAILHSLEDHGLAWDGEVVWQSRRHDRYAQALAQLVQEGRAFPCALSRTQLDACGGRHPGRAAAAPSGSVPVAWRFDVHAGVETFIDRIQGEVRGNPGDEEGPFVIRRRDGLWAYQLAVVVDDAAQGITQVVRGADLLESTLRQLPLQRALGLPQPGYAHIPVLADAVGEKFSKQQQAAPVTRARRLDNLRLCLSLLGQVAPPANAGLEELLAHAVTHWDIGRVPRRRYVTLPA